MPGSFTPLHLRLPRQRAVAVAGEKPLRHQLIAERPDSFDWSYEAQGAELWRVLISRR